MVGSPHVLVGPVVIHLTASGDLERLGKSFAPGEPEETGGRWRCVDCVVPGPGMTWLLAD